MSWTPRRAGTAALLLLLAAPLVEAQSRLAQELPVPVGHVFAPTDLPVPVARAFEPVALVLPVADMGGTTNASATATQISSDLALPAVATADQRRTPVDLPLAPTDQRNEAVPAQDNRPDDAASLTPALGSATDALPFALLGATLSPGTFRKLVWDSVDSFAASEIPATVLVAHGVERGPVLCLTAAIHGDELNGIETVRRIMNDLDPDQLRGTVVGVPIVNVQGFNRGSRYLPDRRDLNRFFPGNRRGSAASRIAHSLFTQVIRSCEALVDLHTGSFQRTNLPQIRADLEDPGTRDLAAGFGSTVILHTGGQSGTLRAAATQAGIPTVTLEAGGPLQVQPDAVAASEAALRTLLAARAMYPRDAANNPAPPTAPMCYRSRWVRTDHGGILASAVALGAEVTVGELLASVVDPLSNERHDIRADSDGRVLGMAFDQFVMPGYATFHLGTKSTLEDCIGADEGDIDEAADGEAPAG